MIDRKPISKELDDFLKKYANDLYSLRVFLFFTTHPYAQFSEMAVISAVGQGGEKRCVQKAIKNFVEKGVISKSISHRVIFYSLLEDVRDIALEMDNLDQRQRGLIMADFNVAFSNWCGSILRMPLPAVGF
jgi:hypothetical protein